MFVCFIICRCLRKMDEAAEENVYLSFGSQHGYHEQEHEYENDYYLYESDEADHGTYQSASSPENRSCTITNVSVTETAEEKREKKREKIVQEILDSEDSYQNHLNLITKVLLQLNCLF